MERIFIKLNKKNLFEFEQLNFYEVTLQYSCKKCNKYFKLRKIS